MESSSNSSYNGSSEEILTKLASPINIPKLVLKRKYQYKLDQNQDWVNELLSELNEEVELEELRKSPPGQLQVDVGVEKRFKGELQEYVLVSAKAKANFYRVCTKCLCTMPDQLEVELSTCFLDSTFAQSVEYKDQDTIFCDMTDYELYFYQKKQLDLKELVHEHLYLHINPNPIHSEDCKGLCQICGTNLNIENCGH